MALARWAAPVLAQWLHAKPGPFFLGYIRGNTVAFVGWIGISIVVGGFFEELLFRGFLLNRIADACGLGWIGVAVGVLAQAAIFGSLHLYAGSFAFVYAALFAMANGACYLLVRRNLWPLVAVHAIWDSIAIWGVYSG